MPVNCLAVWLRKPSLIATNVTVSVAAIAIGSGLPVSQSRPDGMSIAIIGFLALLIAVITV